MNVKLIIAYLDTRMNQFSYMYSFILIILLRIKMLQNHVQSSNIILGSVSHEGLEKDEVFPRCRIGLWSI